MKKHTMMFLAAALMFTVAEAWAQGQKGGAAAPAAAPAAGAPAAEGGAGGGVTYKQKTVYDFDDDLVEGDLVRPDGDMLDSRGKAKHSSLIKIRPDFIPELLKSVESI